jgi:shikimate kinase
MNIVLFGFMGTGKSSVGKILAEKLGWAFFDTDAMIEKETGFTVPEIFSNKGEPAFRDLESKTIALVSLMDKAVISTGGGVPLREENVRELEKNGVTVCLTAKPENILKRLKLETDHRPLLKDGDPFLKIEALLSARRPAYAKARHQIPTDDLTPAQVAEKILLLVK